MLSDERVTTNRAWFPDWHDTQCCILRLSDEMQGDTDSQSVRIDQWEQLQPGDVILDRNGVSIVGVYLRERNSILTFSYVTLVGSESRLLDWLVPTEMWHMVGPLTVLRK